MMSPVEAVQRGKRDIAWLADIARVTETLMEGKCTPEDAAVKHLYADQRYLVRLIEEAATELRAIYSLGEVAET